MRNVLRWIIVTAGSATAVWLLVAFWSNFQGWQATTGTDPSAAELYGDGCLIDGGMAIGVSGVALILFYFLGLDTGERPGEPK